MSLEVRDLAGNTVLCEMGEVMASADNAGLDLLILAITAAIFLIFGIWWVEEGEQEKVKMEEMHKTSGEDTEFKLKWMEIVDYFTK